MSQDRIGQCESEVVRAVRRDEEPGFSDLVRERYYLGFRQFRGSRLRPVGLLGERRLALLGWYAAAPLCFVRDRQIGSNSL